MRLLLNDYDRSVLNGEHGEGTKVAMNILTAFSDAIGATCPKRRGGEEDARRRSDPLRLMQWR
jgi:hypothetical protein